MTAQEKAEELVNEFWTLIGANQDALWIAKNCATKCVDEIIKVLPHPDYWQEVKQEIEKL